MKPRINWFTPVRWMLAIAVMGMLTVGGAATALATNAAGQQNPQLRVALSLPDQATAGATVSAAVSVTNTTSSRQSVTVTTALTEPSGKTDASSQTVTLGARQTLARSYTYQVPAGAVKGVYRVTVAATNRAGASSATATIEIV